MNKEQEIINKILEKAATIKTTAGYYTNVGDVVKDFNDKTIPSDYSSYLELRDPQTTFLQKGDPGYLENAHKQQMMLEVFVQFNKKDISYVRQAIADVYRMIGLNKWWFWDELKVRFVPLRHQKAVYQEDKEMSSAKIFLLVEFVTAEWGYDEPV